VQATVFRFRWFIMASLLKLREEYHKSLPVCGFSTVKQIIIKEISSVGSLLSEKRGKDTQ